MSVVGITAIVVSCGLDGLLASCLDLLGRAMRPIGDPARNRIVVVDNASISPYVRENLRVDAMLRFDARASFARANNRAAQLCPNDVYLLVNNDVLLAEHAIEHALNILLSRPRAGLCGSRLIFPDGTIQHRGVAFGNGDIGPYHIDRGKPTTVVARPSSEWQAVTGACLLVRREVWEELGGLDEGYPFGLEDIDLCLRARRRGWRVLCAEATDSLHFESTTPGRTELDVPSRRRFLDLWKGRYAIDG